MLAAVLFQLLVLLLVVVVLVAVLFHVFGPVVLLVAVAMLFLVATVMCVRRGGECSCIGLLLLV